MHPTLAPRFSDEVVTQQESPEIATLRQELQEVLALAERFRREMGSNFYLTIQHTAHADRLRKELYLATETPQQRESRLDAEADAAMDAIEARFFGPEQLQTQDALEPDEDDPQLLASLAKFDSPIG